MLIATIDVAQRSSPGIPVFPEGFAVVAYASPSEGSSAGHIQTLPPPDLAGRSPGHWPDAGGVPPGEQTRKVRHIRLPVAASKASRWPRASSLPETPT